MATLAPFVGLRVVDEQASPFRRISLREDGAMAYHVVVEPASWEDADSFHEHGAAEYDLLVRVGPDGLVEDFAFRVDQCPHGRRNFAPGGAPAWIFSEGSRFPLGWSDIAPAAQGKMVGLLEGLTGVIVQ